MSDERDNLEQAEHQVREDEDDSASYTVSLTSSVQDYRYENGRRYHAYRDGIYFMPNDETEQECMDLMHHVSSMILGGEMYRAPVSTPQAILDIGTGTGIWAMDVADEYPSAHVTGVDLSPIQPTWLPANANFEVDDCEGEWLSSQQFDFIHMRNLSGAISDWPALLRKCQDHLKPGGWIECSNIEAWAVSHNGTLPSDSASNVWQENLRVAGSVIGREMNMAPHFAQLLGDGGFQEVTDEQFKVPMSPWMSSPSQKELARHFFELVSMELEAMSLRLFTGVLKWSPERLYTLLDKVRREIQNESYQMYSTMHYVYGRKEL